jgi:hypothetical protein
MTIVNEKLNYKKLSWPNTEGLNLSLSELHSRKGTLLRLLRTLSLLDKKVETSIFQLPKAKVVVAL